MALAQMGVRVRQHHGTAGGWQRHRHTSNADGRTRLTVSAAPWEDSGSGGGGVRRLADQMTTVLDGRGAVVALTGGRAPVAGEAVWIGLVAVAAAEAASVDDDARGTGNVMVGPPALKAPFDQSL